MTSEPIKAYICGTDLKYEMREPAMLGDCRITPNERFAREKWKCTTECGIAEVEVRFVRWIVEPTI